MIHDSQTELDPTRCMVLVPVNEGIEPDCANALTELERRGYPIWREYGSSGIDQVRSQMATEALAAGFEELMWIDPDISFPADAVEQLRRHELAIVCGIHATKGRRELAVGLEPGTRKLTFGDGGGLVQIRHAAAGFMLTKRQVYDKIQEREQLPRCNTQFGRPAVPYFLPLTVPVGNKHWYLAEDFAFCARARRSGFDVLADTRIRLGRVDRRSYGWEDAGSSRERHAAFTFEFG